MNNEIMKTLGFILMMCMMAFLQVACENEEPERPYVTSDMFLQISNRTAKVSHDGKYYILTECVDEAAETPQVKNVFIVDLEEDAAEIAALNAEYVLVGGVGQKTDYRPANGESRDAYYMLKITSLSRVD